MEEFQQKDKRETNRFSRMLSSRSLSSINEPEPVKSFRKRLFKRDKKKVRKYLTSTSTHGLKYLVGKSTIRRIIWGMLFTIALIALLYNIINSLIRFAVVIPTATTVSSVHVSQLEFPSVTICNINPFNKTFIKENDIFDVVRSSVDLELTSSVNFTDEFHEQCSQFKSIISDRISVEDLFRGGGQPLRDLIVDCHFLGVECDLEEDFTPTLSPLGLCYTFNAKKPVKVVDGSGYRHELNVILNVRQNEFIGSLNDEAGVRVSFQPLSTPPLPISYGTVVPVGKSAYMGMRILRIEDKTNIQNSENCIKSNSHTFSILPGYEYSLSACLYDCILNSIVETCKCLNIANDSAPSSSAYSTKRRCTTSDLCCITATILTAPSCSCTLACNHTQYDITTTYATFPSTFKRETVAERYNLTVQTVDESLISLHIYFDELIRRQEVTERSYTPLSLVADVGGQMGLFLGASLLSATEFLIWLIDEFKDRCLGINEREIKKKLDVHKLVNSEVHNNNGDLTLTPNTEITSNL